MINGGFTEVDEIEKILKDDNKLTGCMVGRMAMNNTWEIAKIDAAFFDENLDDRPTREEIIRLYADFA